MNFLLQRISDPDIEPITLAEAKRHIRQFANVTSEDGDIAEWIKVAREWVEDYTGRAMVDQGWRLTLSSTPWWPLRGDSVGGYNVPGWAGTVFSSPYQKIYLRRSPVLAITRLATIDPATGVETTVDPAEYIAWDSGSKWPRIVPVTGASWSGGDLLVEYRAGFADRLGSPVTGAEVIPAVLKHAVKLVLANYDENRGLVNVGNIVSELPLGLQWLLAGQKCDLGIM